MAPIPFIGRLHPYEYLALLLSFVLAILELFVRTVTLLLPTPIIRFLYRISRNAFNSLSSPYSRRARNKKKAVSSPIAQASDFVELCELYGYTAEENIVQTKDGYLLGLHRLAWRKGEEDLRVNSGPNTLQKKVVYLHHGLLMNSEVWVCMTEKERCLPFLLVDQGYDVWLGNNRGNKYSKKSMHHAPTEVEFWDFSMDQFAFHDIPDSINYILTTTGQPSLSYIGFSQGTAQAFATLSIHPTLNNKVDVFVALAPAMAPPGLASGVVSSLVKTNPGILFLLFGRRAILGSTTMWQALLYPAIFAWFIDKSLSFLFNWKMRNITPHQKLAAYPHLYSFTSTKSVVHWFQIINNGTFQMYDDEVSTPLSLSHGSKYYKVAKFPTRNIRTPIVLVYGGSDSLVDIKLMLKELPRHTVARCIPKYEHLDLLWASDVEKLVFPHVLESLEWYAQPEKTKAGALGWRSTSIAPLPSPLNGGSQPPGYSEDERVRGRSAIEPGNTIPNDVMAAFREASERPNTGDTLTEEQLDESDYDEEESFNESYNSTPERLALTPQQAFASRQVVSLPVGLDGISAPKNRTGRGMGALAEELPGLGGVREEGGTVRSTSNHSTATTVIASPSEAMTGHAHSSTTAQPAKSVVTVAREAKAENSRHRTISPKPRNGHERHVSSDLKRPQQRRTGSGGVERRIANRSTSDESGDDETVVAMKGKKDRRVGPEGWWSSTSTSSLDVAGVGTSKESLTLR